MTIYCDTTFFIGLYVAIDLYADLFLTFDERQLATATVVGLKTILPKRR